MADRPELALLLSDQFTLLDDFRPVDARAHYADDRLEFAFGWPLPPADRLLLGTAYAERVLKLRVDLLELIMPSLTDLVEVDLHRVVRDQTAAIGADPRQASVEFELGAARSSGVELEALQEWSAHVRGEARRLRPESGTGREEPHRAQERREGDRRPEGP